MDFIDAIQHYLHLDGSAPALLFGDRWWTYGELADAVGGLSTAMAALGATDGVPVAAAMPNTPESVVTVLAALIQRACLVPLSPRRPEAELERCPPVGIVLGPDGAAPRVEHADAAHLPGIAWLLGTAGTTGEPKRIPVTFAAIDASLAGTRSMTGRAAAPPAPKLRPDVNIVCFPMYHLSGLLPLLITLLTGRKTALLPKFDAHRVAALVHEYEITSLALNPTTIAMLVDADIDTALLASLRFVRSGSASLRPELAAAFEAKFGLSVLQAYGQTETGGEIIGWSPADHREFGVSRRGSVGRPHPGITATIIAPGTNPDVDGQPPDTSGELWVRGIRGTVGWHRTGDLARVDRDGFVWVEGRADDIIICGGFNVAPLAIERVLATHPDIADAAVVGVPEPRLGAVPVAVVAPRDGSRPPEDELRAWCLRSLEPYQVPRAFVWTDELPRNDVGKVHRPSAIALAEAALPQPAE